MLQPKKTKFRRSQKGRIKGNAQRGNDADKPKQEFFHKMVRFNHSKIAIYIEKDNYYLCFYETNNYIAVCSMFYNRFICK